MERLAAAHGYKKTNDCYWVQIFDDTNGNTIVTAREDYELDYDPAERLVKYLAPAEVEPENENDDNREHCERIAKELDEYINGEVYRCPECGEHCAVNVETNENGDTVYECACGCVSEYEPEPLGVYDWAEDVLDIEYRVTGRHADDLRSVRILVAYGGPNIYVDTATRSVELYWWGDRASYPISHAAAAALDEWAAEYWACL